MLDHQTADVNQDGILDIVVGRNFFNDVQILLGNGDFTFNVQTIPNSSNARDIVAEDLNSDGFVDLVTTDQFQDDAARIFLGNGDGSFVTDQTFWIGALPSDLVSSDFNNDGLQDLATACRGSDEIRFNLNRFAGEFILGDINGDGLVNLLDVQPFVQLLSSGNFQVEADINCDATVNLLDVAPFIDLLTN